MQLKTLPETVSLEHQDRVQRFARLSDLYGIRAPQLSELQVDAGKVPGLTYAVPVVHVVFDERVFFDFNKDELRRDAERVLDVVAENMKRDVPDAQLLVLGHTDAIGSDVYNFDLSRRRAVAVIAGLVRRGVNAGQLSAIPIGKRQPIAANDSDEGRARNRRVEFMISADQRANLQVVESRVLQPDLLKTGPEDVPSRVPIDSVELLQPVIGPQLNDDRSIAIALQPVGDVKLQEPGLVRVREPEPERRIELNKPAQYRVRPLNNDFVP